MATLGEGCIIAGQETFNTGIENDCALGLPKGVIIVPSTAKWTKADMADPLTWLTANFHLAPSLRWLPVLKGISGYDTARESNVTETNDVTRTTAIIALGGYTFTYRWNKGGMCLAARLSGAQGKGYSYIPFDEDNKFGVKLNPDGTYSGLSSTDITNDYLPKTTSTVGKNVLIFSTPFKEYVSAKIFNLDVDVENFNGLIDVEVYKGAAPTITAAPAGASGTVTITALGSDNDTVNLKVNTVTISGVVTKTSAETTIALLATKIAAAITALTSTNGGYTASASGAIVTVQAPASLGSTLNMIAISPTTTGGITQTVVAFANGVTASAKLRLAIRTECGHTDLLGDSSYATIFGASFASLLVFTDKATKAVITPTSAAIVNVFLEVTGPFLSGHTYITKGTAPSVWKGLFIEGYDAANPGDGGVSEHLVA